MRRPRFVRPAGPAGLVGLAGWVALVGSAAGALGLVVLRVTPLQERRPHWLALAGLSEQVLVVLAGIGCLGALAVWWADAPRWRRWALLGVVAPAVLVQSVWPTAVGLVRPERSRSGVGVSVLAQNLWRRNRDPDRVARALVASGADVLVLTEFTVAHQQAFRRAGGDEVYPYRVARPRRDTDGMAVMSRVPLEAPEHQVSRLRTTVTLLPSGGEPVHLVAVHVPSPSSQASLRRWSEELGELTGAVPRLEGPVVVAGDFNATSAHRPFRRLAEEAGLVDAQDAGGGGFGATWSRDGRWPPLMRLDHVMVGPGVGIEGFELTSPLGSDHAGVRTEIRVPRP